MIAAVASGFQRLSEEDAASVRPHVQVISILPQSRPLVSNLLAAERMTIKHLCDDSDILILPANKGQLTVITDRCKYEKKARNIGGL